MMFSPSQAHESSPQWKQIDRFVKANRKELAALAWGLYQENLQQDQRDRTLGIDLKPSPHFVCFSREAIEQLNQNVDDMLREVLGILDGHKPEKEVLIIGIGYGTIKLIQYESTPSPPECFAKMGATVNTLLDQLEARLAPSSDDPSHPS